MHSPTLTRGSQLTSRSVTTWLHFVTSPVIDLKPLPSFFMLNHSDLLANCQRAQATCGGWVRCKVVTAPSNARKKVGSTLLFRVRSGPFGHRLFSQQSIPKGVQFAQSFANIDHLLISPLAFTSKRFRRNKSWNLQRQSQIYLSANSIAVPKTISASYKHIFYIANTACKEETQKNNCMIVKSATSLSLRAIRNIEAGCEVLLSYGTEYERQLAADRQHVAQQKSGYKKPTLVICQHCGKSYYGGGKRAVVHRTKSCVWKSVTLLVITLGGKIKGRV